MTLTSQRSASNNDKFFLVTSYFNSFGNLWVQDSEKQESLLHLESKTIL